MAKNNMNPKHKGPRKVCRARFTIARGRKKYTVFCKSNLDVELIETLKKLYPEDLAGELDDLFEECGEGNPCYFGLISTAPKKHNPEQETHTSYSIDDML